MQCTTPPVDRSAPVASDREAAVAELENAAHFAGRHASAAVGGRVGSC